MWSTIHAIHYLKNCLGQSIFPSTWVGRFWMVGVGGKRDTAPPTDLKFFITKIKQNGYQHKELKVIIVEMLSES